MEIVINQVVIAQWLARRLAAGEVLGSNPGKGENLLKKIIIMCKSFLDQFTFPDQAELEIYIDQGSIS